MPGRRPIETTDWSSSECTAGVLVEHELERVPAGDERASDRLSRRARQRVRDLDGLRQPLLAGALLRGRRGQHSRPPFREGRDEKSERVIQRLLGVERELVSVRGVGVEARPTGTTCARLRRISASTGTAPRLAGWPGVRKPYLRAPGAPPSSTTGRSAASGRSGRRLSCSSRPAGPSRTRFHARDADLVLSPGTRIRSPSACSSTARLPAPHWCRRRRSRQRRTPTGRMYQLVRAHDDVRDWTVRSRSSSPAPRRTCSRSDSDPHLTWSG